MKYKLLILFPISCLLTCFSVFAQKQINHPNILFIPVDDLRPELGCYGNRIIQTPNMDRLARNGLVFTRAYCQQAVCNPSRASLLTGLRPDTLQVWDLQTPFRGNLPDAVTLPQYFKANGYQTIGIGKAFHNIFPDSLSWSEALHVNGFPFDPDAVYTDEPNISLIAEKKKKFIEKKDTTRIDQYGQWYIKANAMEKADVPDDAYYDGAQTTLVIQKLHQLKENKQPFFLSIGFYKPHLPFNAPIKYWNLYSEKDLPIATNPYIPDLAPEFAISGGDAELRSYDDQHDLPTPMQTPLSKERQKQLVHGYYASISYIDAQIGRLLDELDKLDLTQNTLIVLWGDHGWKLGEHNGWCKQTNYEIDTRGPLIVSGFGVKAKNQHSAALVELVDIYPSLCVMAGLRTPGYLQGKSFVSLTDNPVQPWKKAAFSQFLMGHFPKKESGKNDRMGYTIRTDGYRYVEWYTWKDNKKGQLIAKELYDEKKDPQENRNVVNEPNYQKLAPTLSRQLSEGWRKAMR
jgi:arylsulfatase A-like enzyme